TLDLTLDGDDYLDGEEGDDVLNGGGGADYLLGGEILLMQQMKGRRYRQFFLDRLWDIRIY
ncbi:MAG TPA: hypothetical protein PKI53_10925, partial [Candidatus Aminicenantes bacterium]|nr:hypothetical protein [Candidatus Aminicenantes bacterium]